MRLDLLRLVSIQTVGPDGSIACSRTMLQPRKLEVIVNDILDAVTLE